MLKSSSHPDWSRLVMTNNQELGRGPEGPLYPDSSSYVRSLLFRSFAWPRLVARRLRLDRADGAVLFRSNLVRHPPDVGLGHLVHAVEIAEQLAPNAVARLIGGKLLRQALVTGKPSSQVGLGARLEHLQFFIGNVLRLQLVDLVVYGFLHLFVGVAGQRHGIERKQVAVLYSRKAGESGREGGYLFVALHRAEQARGAAIRQNVADRVIHRVVRRQITWPVVALQIERLRRIVQCDLAHRILRRLVGE